MLFLGILYYAWISIGDVGDRISIFISIRKTRMLEQEDKILSS